MTKKVKVNTGEHIAQNPHTAEDCLINEKPYNHPETDCGHTVKGIGPGEGMPKAEGGTYWQNQDPEKGPAEK